MICIQMQHVHSISNVNQQEQHDEQEVRDVDKGPQDEGHLEGRAVVESEAVHYRLHSLTYQNKRLQNPLMNNTQSTTAH